MLKVAKSYRKDYTGEDIITERRKEGNLWYETVETVPNAITNNQISNRAVVIGNSPSRLEFNINHLKKFSGLLGADTLQSYGCNALYRDFTPDFLVAHGNDIVKELANSEYIKNNIVYTSAIHLLEYPNKFYLIPYNPYADAGTTAAYIACFDGHKKVYLLGFDEQDSVGQNFNVYAGTPGYDSIDTEILSSKWVSNRLELFTLYDDVDFAWVTLTGKSSIPESHKYCTNFRQISYRTFVLETDL